MCSYSKYHPKHDCVYKKIPTKMYAYVCLLKSSVFATIGTMYLWDTVVNQKDKIITLCIITSVLML